MPILQRLAEVLDALPEELVHGDINGKNLLYDGRALQLIDWEPALLQQRLQQPTMMYTEPYVSQRDRQQQRLSKETDKIGFFFSCLRLLTKRPAIVEPRRLVSQRRRGLGRLTPEPELQFVQRSFIEVYSLALENRQWTAGVDTQATAGYERPEPHEDTQDERQ